MCCIEMLGLQEFLDFIIEKMNKVTIFQPYVVNYFTIETPQRIGLVTANQSVLRSQDLQIVAKLFAYMS